MKSDEVGFIAVVIRWIARVWSALSIVFVLAFAVGEFISDKGPTPTMQEWVGLSLWPIGVCLGLLVAWFRENLGGLLAIACLLGFYAWNLLHSGSFPKGPFFFLVAAPAFLFLFAQWLSQSEPSAGT